MSEEVRTRTEPRPGAGLGAARALAAFLLYLLATLVCDFGFLARAEPPPILNDDWAIHAELVWGRDRPAATRIREIALMSWEGRPLRAIEYTLQLGAFRLLGLRGGFLVQALVIALAALVLALVAAPRLGRGWALLAGLLLVLHPADTTHIWLATMMAKLALLYALLAVLLFARGRSLAAFVLLVAGFASYELSPFAFFLAPWAAGGSRRDWRRAALVFGAALGAYAAWRLLVFSAIAPDLRGAAPAPGGATAALGALAAGLRDVLPVMLVTSFLRSVAALAVGGALAALVLPVLHLRERRRGTPPRPGTPAAAGAFAAGVIACLAGALLAFVAGPTADPGIASRHTIAALPGAALGLAAASAWLCDCLRRSAGGRTIASLLPLLLVSVGGAARLEIQQDYRDASRYQRALLSRMIADLGALPPHTLVVIDEALAGWPERGNRLPSARAMTPLVTGLPHEIEAVLALVYDRSIVGIARQDERDEFRVRQATASQIRGEDPPFHSVVVWNARTRASTWLRRLPRDPGEGEVAPGGPALDYLGR